MNAAARHWNDALQAFPLVAILRGLQPERARQTATILVDAGFRIIEVPLNSPRPYESITAIASAQPNVLVGAGTVLSAENVARTADAGGKLIVAPNLCEAVASAALQRELCYVPGIATPTEAFNALQLGAHALKLFPAEMITPSVVKALRAVLPATTRLLPVGGITPESIPAYIASGASGFGLGSALFKPASSMPQLRTAAEHFAAAVR